MKTIKHTIKIYFERQVKKYEDKDTIKLPCQKDNKFRVFFVYYFYLLKKWFEIQYTKIAHSVTPVEKHIQIAA